jgi:acyl carrier protein
MDRESIATEIKTLLISSLGLPLNPSAIGEDEPLWGNRLNIDSLAAIEILTALEDRLGVQFPDEMIDLSLFASVRRLVDAVSALLPNAACSKAQDVS